MMDKDTRRTYLAYWAAIGVAILLTLTIWLLDPLLDNIKLLPDKGPSWYYWKLPSPNVWARITSWGGYALHQITIWFLVIKAIRKKNPSSGVPRRVQLINQQMLGANLFFIILHLVQTHIWYDGLAQDVPIWTSQYSVIVMLVIVLLMLFPRRGVVLGKKINVSKRIIAILRKYHGLYISWALVYTFWFHPMEGDFAILAGFFYMFLLMIQMSFFGTRVHFNLIWIGFLEFFVGIHGTLIAIMNGQAVWTMFLFGFLFMTVFTHIHGTKMKRWIRYGAIALYIMGAVIAYSLRGWNQIYEITFIPAALYGGAFALWAVLGLSELFGRKPTGLRTTGRS